MKAILSTAALLFSSVAFAAGQTSVLVCANGQTGGVVDAPATGGVLFTGQWSVVMNPTERH